MHTLDQLLCVCDFPGPQAICLHRHRIENMNARDCDVSASTSLGPQSRTTYSKQEHVCDIELRRSQRRTQILVNDEIKSDNLSLACHRVVSVRTKERLRSRRPQTALRSAVMALVLVVEATATSGAETGAAGEAPATMGLSYHLAGTTPTLAARWGIYTVVETRPSCLLAA